MSSHTTITFTHKIQETDLLIHHAVGQVLPTGVAFIDHTCNGGLLVGGITELRAAAPILKDTLRSIHATHKISILASGCSELSFYQVFCPVEFDEALDAVEEESVVVVILDYMMIQIVNDALCRSLRLKAVTKGLAVLVLSTTFMWPDEIEGRTKILEESGVAVETSLRPRLFPKCLFLCSPTQSTVLTQQSFIS